LKDINKDVSLATLIEQVKDRDKRDINRKSSPMVAADDASVIDSSEMNIDEVLRLGLDIAKINGI
jgi:cytidylate kinase